MDWQLLRGRVLVLLDRARTSLWLIPSAMLSGAVALSSLLLWTDERLAAAHRGAHWWLFAGNAEGARTLLSVIAGSLITVISVAFSVTIIAIQQASTQYTPRVLRNYTKDRGNQIVLGTYVSTFAFALLTLREVRAAEAGNAAFVPTYSILGAMLLALASLAALVYFMHHVTESLQVSTLLGVIRQDVNAEICRMFPETLGEPVRDPEALADRVGRQDSGCGREVLTLRAEQEGYLRRIDERALAAAATGFELVVVPVQIGDRLHRDTVVLRAWGGEGADGARSAALRGAFQVDRHRSVEQDVRFGIRQLVDIAMKALSPGVNDPTTAEEAIAELVGTIRQLLRRDMPDPVRRLHGATTFLLRVPTFEELADDAFSQVRRAAAPHVHVTLAILDGLRALAPSVPSPTRGEPLAQQAEQILETLGAAPFTAADEARIRRAAVTTLVALRQPARHTSPGGRDATDDAPAVP